MAKKKKKKAHRVLTTAARYARLTNSDIPTVRQNFDSESRAARRTLNTHVRRVMTLETCRCQTRLDLRRVEGDGREDVAGRETRGRGRDARVTYAASIRIRYEPAAGRPIITVAAAL